MAIPIDILAGMVVPFIFFHKVFSCVMGRICTINGFVVKVQCALRCGVVNMLWVYARVFLISLSCHPVGMYIELGWI